MQIHYLTYCLAPVVSTAVSKTVGSLWGPVGVTDSSISVSITLANGVGKGTVAIVVDAELGESGAGLTDESTGTKTKGLGISITLVEALRGPLGIGGSESWVDGDTTANQGSIAVTIVSFGITLTIGSLWGSVAVRGTSRVKASTSKSAEGSIAVAIGISRALTDEVSESTGGVSTVARVDAGLADESTRAQTKTTVSIAESIGVSITLAIGSLWGSVAVRGTSWVKASTSQSTEWCIAIAKGISRALSYGVGKRADSIVMKAKDWKTGAGLTDVSTSISVAVGISIS